MTLAWNERYPDQALLRSEIRCMLEAFVEVLLEEIPQSEIEGIYFKGSAAKSWDSPPDYVPELSDLDIHLLFSDDASVEKHLGSAAQAMHVRSKVEARYFAKIAKPLHVPRPQLVILNLLRRQENYVPSPRRAVSVLYGKEYPEAGHIDPERIRRSDCNSLVEQEEYLSRFPLHIIDKPARYLWDSLRMLVWRVSPTGPRVLEILGMRSDQVWSANRTRVVSLLKELGERQLAEDYAHFYLFGWEYFLSSHTDSSAACSALSAGVKALTRGVEIARAWLAEHPSG